MFGSWWPLAGAAVALVFGLAVAWGGIFLPEGDAAGIALAIALTGLVATSAAFIWGRVWQTRAGREQEIFNQMLWAHAGHAVVAIKPDGVIAALNSGAERLLGYESATVAGRLTWLALHDPAEVRARAAELAAAQAREVAPGFELCVRGVRESREAGERDWTFLRREGATVPVRVSLTAMRDGHGEVLGFLAVVNDLTAPRAAEARQREVAERLSKIASQVPGMVFQYRLRPDGTRCFPYASEGIREIYGLTPAEVVEDASVVREILVEEDRGRVRASLDETARNLTPWQCEYRVIGPDGRMRWLLGNALPEREPDGGTVWHGLLTDITARKAAESAHEESREMLRSIFTSVDIGVFVVDVLAEGEFRFVELNPAYERLTGLTTEQIKGKRIVELVPAMPAELAAGLSRSLLRGALAPESIEFEEPFVARGEIRWWLTRLTPVRDPAGQVVRLVGRSIDITERKSNERRFQLLTERLQLATDAAQVGIWDTDIVQGRVTWDERQIALYGMEATGFDGALTTWRDRVHHADWVRVEQEHRAALEGRAPLNTSYRIVRPSGEERELRARAYVQRNPAGRPVRVVGVNWDVTAERRAQNVILKAKEDAELLNGRLEAALNQAQMLAREAAAATVAKSEFLANMSHEIRTPLNAVIGMSGLLLGSGLNEDQRELAETIRSSGDGLLGLINDILDYSKIESGRLELERRPFDLRQCVESSVDLLAARAAEKGLNLIYHLAEDVPELITGDETRLRQVMVNLLSNAVKFTAQGQVFVSINRVGPSGGPTARLQFSIFDSGMGIPAERMNRLFKTFSQVDASTTRNFGGTGLGLAISQRIVGLMGGAIAVQSTEGTGSHFYFETEFTPVAGPAKAFACGRVAAFHGRRLLIVDANSTVCRVLCQQAVAWGMLPRAATSGAEALAWLARGETFDAAVLDARTPGAGEPALTERLRAAPAGARLPLIWLTSPGAARPAAELRVTAWINKPVKPAALYDALTVVFQTAAAKPAVEVTRAAVMLAEEHPLTILLAEDNPVNQRVAKLMLQGLGYRADIVANGLEALQAVERQAYDVLLTDVQMPEMDGLQATREICARWSGNRRPRIVAITANASTADRQMCLEAGMDDFITKPIRADELRAALLATPARRAALVTAA